MEGNFEMFGRKQYKGQCPIILKGILSCTSLISINPYLSHV